MNSPPEKFIAYFKRQPVRTVPIRSGPIQCFKNCGNCITQQYGEREFDQSYTFKSYDNFVNRRLLFLSNYQSIQYHTGQFGILKEIINNNLKNKFIFLIAVTKSSDIKYLNWILEYMKLPKLNVINPNNSYDSIKDNIALLIQHRSCSVNKYFKHDKSIFFEPKRLREFISITIDNSSKNELKPFIVNVIITKDHDSIITFGLGSVCIQIGEPFSIKNYLITSYGECLSTHMTLHIYHDINRKALILPSHILAFLILFLNRIDGINYQDLIDNVEWLRKNSMDLDLHLGFTGNTNDAVDFGLLILKDYIIRKEDKKIFIKDDEKLMDYAQLVIPIIAYYGIISQAILIEHNRANPDNLITCLIPDVMIKVNRDNVFEIAEQLSSLLEKNLTCKRPCETAIKKLDDTFASMSTINNYLKLRYPLNKIPRGNRRYIGDFEFDDEQYDYEKIREDPLNQTFIIVSRRPYRLDRLNLFMNSISIYMQ